MSDTAIKIRMSYSERKRSIVMADWCEQNCNSRWYGHRVSADMTEWLFENENDATMFVLRWQ